MCARSLAPPAPISSRTPRSCSSGPDWSVARITRAYVKRISSWCVKNQTRRHADFRWHLRALHRNENGDSSFGALCPHLAADCFARAWATRYVRRRCLKPSSWAALPSCPYLQRHTYGRFCPLIDRSALSVPPLTGVPWCNDTRTMIDSMVHVCCPSFADQVWRRAHVAVRRPRAACSRAACAGLSCPSAAVRTTGILCHDRSANFQLWFCARQADYYCMYNSTDSLRGCVQRAVSKRRPGLRIDAFAPASHPMPPPTPAGSCRRGIHALVRKCRACFEHLCPVYILPPSYFRPCGSWLNLCLGVDLTVLPLCCHDRRASRAA